MKRAIIIHGWDGHPGEGWFPWLKEELENNGFQVTVPAMPHPDVPTIDDWVGALAAAVGTPDTETVLIGHSMGCQTILRYVDGLPEGQRIGGAVLVAGFLRLKPIIKEEEGVEEIFQPWLETPIDMADVRKKIGACVCIFSDDDDYVYHEDAPMFAKNLGAEMLLMHKMGHFSGSNGMTELPEALDAVLRITSR